MRDIVGESAVIANAVAKDRCCQVISRPGLMKLEPSPVQVQGHGDGRVTHLLLQPLRIPALGDVPAREGMAHAVRREVLRKPSRFYAALEVPDDDGLDHWATAGGHEEEVRATKVTGDAFALDASEQCPKGCTDVDMPYRPRLRRAGSTTLQEGALDAE